MEPNSTESLPPTSIDGGEAPPGSGLKRTVTILIMVLGIGAVAYLLSGRSGTTDATNLVGLVGTDQIESEWLLQTDDPIAIEDILREELGLRLRVPMIVGTSIEGVGTWDADRNVRIPVILYSDPSEDIGKMLILNYVMLDQMSSAVFLDRSIRMELEQDRSYTVVSASDNREVVLWRVGDDIFVAIAENGAGRLIPRITQSGSGSQG